MRTISWDAGRNGTNFPRGFTLVELLIVITIIGVLVALLMPAVNNARESGRRAVCQNNLHQMALGCVQLESKYGYFPGGGWGWQCGGEPDRGYGAQQPGGWLYNILPFIDQNDLHDMGKGVPDATRRQKALLQAQTPVSVFVCPTRHKLQVYPYNHGAAYWNIPDPYPVIARCDYAANSGSTYLNVQPGAPNTGYSPTFDWSTIDGTVNSNPATNSPSTGVIYRASQCSTAMIKDGTSNVYLAGERYMDPDCYSTGGCCDNDQGWDEGYDYDTDRGTGYGYYKQSDSPSNGGKATPDPPLRDRKGVVTNGGCCTNFGSAHEAGFHMAFCDGKVQLINFSIDPVLHMQLGHRSDGEPTSMEGLSAGRGN